jgi:hypothetical protein
MDFFSGLFKGDEADKDKDKKAPKIVGAQHPPYARLISGEM